MLLFTIFSIFAFITFILKQNGYNHCFCPECGHLNLHLKIIDKIYFYKGIFILLILILIGKSNNYSVVFIGIFLMTIYILYNKKKKINKSCTKCNSIF